MTSLPVSPVVLVVGATGALGKKITQSFAREKLAGKAVTLKAMSRRVQPKDAQQVVEWVVGDILKPATLPEVLKGVDVVVSSANGYMKESIEADIDGNRNLIEACAKAGVKRFVFLSIVRCEQALNAPHMKAKYVAEELLKTSGVPFVSIRAPAFLDQEPDYNAQNAKAGRFMAIGNAEIPWSYTYSPDLANDLVKAALYPGNDINNQLIDVGWEDGPKTQIELAKLIGDSLTVPKELSIIKIRRFILFGLGKVIGWFSPFAYDMVEMFRFFEKGTFVSDLTLYHKFFGPSPSSTDAVKRWAKSSEL